jgi:acetyltransferase-like isoleucine patch superfamily enzyme
MFWGDHVSLGPDSFLYCSKQYPSPRLQKRLPEGPVQEFESRIVVGNNVTATGGLQLAAQSEIVIEDDVMFATNIQINDALHGFNHANEPYKYQPLQRISPIRIKRGSWIGQNVVILPGVTVGELSIIGANSVVTKSIPDRCIALGNPARVTKRWDTTSESWIVVK